MKASYYPILKWKQGEQEALQGLEEDVKDKLCPIIEIRNNAKSSRELYRSLDHYWKQRPLIVDYAEPTGLLIDQRQNMVTELLAQIEKNNDRCVIFCFWLKMIELGDLNDIVARVKGLPQPICLRIQGNSEQLLNSIARLGSIYEEHGLTPSKIILLLDSKSTPITSENDQEKIAEVLGSDFMCSHYALVLSSGAFPKTAEIKPNKELIDRTDMTAWLRISEWHERYRTDSVSYSDYTCHDPSWEDKLEKEEKNLGYHVKPIIRYAEDSIWRVYKINASEDAVALTKLMLRQSDFLKNCKCPGCHRIRRRASPESIDMPGSYANHLTEGIIHHIYTVIQRNLEI
ncbi:beta family protein [Rheinheimera oceanensis]|uniref:beta family protein n=1 Tax=Rheinheimera oceanensis TaxID=2817449 RepID=UPI001BFEBDC6|nr:beta family protein [Rheinheimera oceanensis]